MKVLNIKVRHVMGLRDAVEMDVRDDNLIFVGGRNGQGKSSTLNAVKMALCGRRGTEFPEKIIHDGEDHAEVEIQLSGDPSLGEDSHLTVRWTVDKKRAGEVEDIQILDSAGYASPNPRTLLRDLYHARAFDPLAFERLAAKDQRESLAKLVGVDLEAARSEYKDIYASRTELNREVKKVEIRHANAACHVDVPDEPVNVSDLVAELEKIRKQNSELDHYTEIVNSYAKAQQKAIERVTKTEEKLRLLAEELEASQIAFKESCKNHDDAKKHLLTLPDHKCDKAILQNISFAGETNEKVAENQAAQKLKGELKVLQSQSGDLTAKLKEINSGIDQQLRDATFPVEGMSIDKEGVLLNGRAFSDNSRSERIAASAKIGMAMNPTLKLLICEDGSDLDADCMDALDAFMSEHDFQCICELVTRSSEDEDRCKVVLQNGAAK